MFKLIIIFAFLFFIFGNVVKFLIKYFIMNAVQKHSYKETRPHRKEGTVYVDDFQPKKDSFKDRGGEYTDYEVVK